MMNHKDRPDEEARGAEFVRLITVHQLDIYLYVHSLMPDPDEAAEVVQDTNMALWEKRSQFDTTKDFRAWAFQFARNKLMQHRDQRKRKCVCFSDAMVDELALQAPQYLQADSDLVHGLRRCVAELTVSDRRLLSQRYSPLATCESIAKAVGHPVTWVYNSLRRIRRELLDCISRHGTSRREPWPS
jgi:RNA polymerase sigma-70 factor, ECF subfamily